MDENATDLIRCPVENCDRIVDSNFIMQLVSDADARQKYQYLIVDNFVQVNRFGISMHFAWAICGYDLKMT